MCVCAYSQRTCSIIITELKITRIQLNETWEGGLERGGKGMKRCIACVGGPSSRKRLVSARDRTIYYDYVKNDSEWRLIVLTSNRFCIRLAKYSKVNLTILKPTGKYNYLIKLILLVWRLPSTWGTKMCSEFWYSVN